MPRKYTKRKGGKKKSDKKKYRKKKYKEKKCQKKKKSIKKGGVGLRMNPYAKQRAVINVKTPTNIVGIGDETSFPTFPDQQLDDDTDDSEDAEEFDDDDEFVDAEEFDDDNEFVDVEEFDDYDDYDDDDYDDDDDNDDDDDKANKLMANYLEELDEYDYNILDIRNIIKDPDDPVVPVDPVLIYITLDEHLCEILPFKCRFGFKLYYTLVLEFDGISFQVLDILDTYKNSIYGTYTQKAILRNKESKQDFVDYLNKWMFGNLGQGIVSTLNPDEWDESIFVYMPLKNIFILETKQIYKESIPKNYTLILDFNKIVEDYMNGQPLDDILEPIVTITNCDLIRSINYNQCKDVDQSDCKCATNFKKNMFI